jgi:DNA-binding NarL/FixJ family response regulator
MLPNGGSDGQCLRGYTLPPDALVIAPPATVRPTSAAPRERYHEPRSRKLTPTQCDAIRAAAGGRSLRSLASEFNVSHETIRAALREPVSLAAD